VCKKNELAIGMYRCDQHKVLQWSVWPSPPVRDGQISWPYSWPSHTIYSGAEIINIGVTPNFQAWILLTYFSLSRLSKIHSTNISLRFYLLSDRYISIDKNIFIKDIVTRLWFLLQDLFSTKLIITRHQHQTFYWKFREFFVQRLAPTSSWFPSWPSWRHRHRREGVSSGRPQWGWGTPGGH